MIPIFPGLELPILPVLLLGLGVGVLSGFTGVGGGFVVTPALIVLGLPVDLAVGTSLVFILCNSLLGLILHRKSGHADLRLGLCMALPSLAGVELGVRLVQALRAVGLQDVVILSASILFMLFFGAFTLTESLQRRSAIARAEQAALPVPPRKASLAKRIQALRLPPMLHFKHSGISLSLWVVASLGLIIGVLTGLLGVGGGFVIIPSLIYLLGVPALISVGTSSVQVLLSSFYGGLRYLLAGTVALPLALLILSTAIPGTIFGASAIKQVRGMTIRLVLGATILIVCAGSIFKLAWMLTGRLDSTLAALANIVTFTGLGAATGMVILVKFIQQRLHQEKTIPVFFRSFFE